MGEHKGAILLCIIALVVFGLWYAFTSGAVKPLLDQIGTGMSNMVTNVFKAIPTAGK
ncbi:MULTISPECIES: hypothetical protein [Bacillus cereus group]|uniref:hypothetical protein n=1 Tax=Bacillus cereus group TaxID=86661 RepID=UPI000279EF22|nr:MULTISPECIES: hypothetical protein [Bacillus cereus group]EJR25712.1 hypothetical protein IIE_06205 [Bacillus cereus VD045]